MPQVKSYGKEQRQREAAERQQAREKLSPQEQLAIIDARLGKGVGATKERARLQKMIEAQG